ncbi:MAG: hypothetical protein AB7D92_01270 [Sphaerochaeta sp.]
MRKNLFLVLLLLVLLAPLAAAQFDFTYGEDVPQSVIDTVFGTIQEALLSRLGEKGTLFAELMADEQQEGYHLSLAFQEKTLEYHLLGDPETFEKRLYSALNHDGTTLLNEIPSPALTFVSGRGYGVERGDLKVGESALFNVLDSTGVRRGMVITNEVADQEGLLFFSQISGKPLFLGMGIQETGNTGVSLSLSFDKALTSQLDLLVAKPLPWYPFSFHLGFSSNLMNQHYGSMGISAMVPLSNLLHGKNWAVRNLSLEGTSLLSAGYDTTLREAIFQASGEVALTCRVFQWAFSLAVGNRITATESLLLEQGLFLKLGTAYTY